MKNLQILTFYFCKFIRKAAQGKFDEALKIIKRDNPFPAICGRVCPHGCESECTRGDIDEAIAIDDIKKYIADKELESASRYIPTIHEKRKGKIGIIGAGPAGLSCAYYAAIEGFEVWVFQGFEAFYLAIGAQEGRMLGLEGENLEGVTTGIEFLRKVSSNTAETLKGKTIVIGGGNVAIDVARTATRMGAETTDMYCLESEDTMPALLEEQEEAKAEGVKINHSWAPKSIIGKNNKVIGMEFMRCVSVFDENGRFSPTYDENEVIIVECSNVIISVGQAINWGELLTDSNMELTNRNTIVVDELTLQSAQSDVFAGGDAITGPRFAIDAIASGKTGAISIKRYLLGQDLTIRREREYHPFDKSSLILDGFDRQPREKTKKVDYEISKKTFKDLRTVLTDEQIKKETSRCLGCGISIVDEYQCMGCGVCTTKCEFDAIHLKRKYDVASATDPEQWVVDYMTYSQERKKRIEEKKKANLKV